MASVYVTGRGHRIRGLAHRPRKEVLKAYEPFKILLHSTENEVVVLSDVLNMDRKCNEEVFSRVKFGVDLFGSKRIWPCATLILNAVIVLDASVQVWRIVEKTISHPSVPVNARDGD